MDSESPTTIGSDLDNEFLASSASSNYSLTTPTGVPSAQALIENMKSTLEALDYTLGELHGQTMQIALLGGDPQIAQDIENVRRQLKDHDKRQKDGIQEIQCMPCSVLYNPALIVSFIVILKHVLECEVVKLLKKQVEDDVAREIEDLVAEQVAVCLKTHIPQDLQDEIAGQQRILEEVRRDLHNSESRRSNASLRSNHEDDALLPIYKADGSTPDMYPPTLKALFDMDAPTSRALMMEYELADYSDSRERNLNRLMQFLGVRYQMNTVRADNTDAKTFVCQSRKLSHLGARGNAGRILEGYAEVLQSNLSFDWVPSRAQCIKEGMEHHASAVSRCLSSIPDPQGRKLRKDIAGLEDSDELL
ncbi:hypothetical protein FB451DRAFT_1456578 [Mycena latifolia]|nr:hypothetical protein FB451DRAFT_1456578 [Mycena latifolia]